MAERAIDPAALRAQLRRLLQVHGNGGPWLHREVGKRMAQRLLLVRKRPQHILEWAGMLGGSDEVLSATYPDAARTVVEPDEAWAALTRALCRPAWWSPRRWSGAATNVITAADAVPAESCQLVWANMVLHGEIDPPRLLQRWYDALQVGGFLMFSSLGPDTLKQLRPIYSELGWGPPGADFVDMHDLGDMLVQCGFADPVMDQETLTLTWASAGELLAELRGLGGNVSPNRHPGLRTPRWRAGLEAGLQRLRGPDGRLALTFEVAYGHAFKVERHRRDAEQSTVSLDEMRKLVREPRRLER
ncbi:class I SAM-dependent methyltransferase [Piscinibacter sakaiensis]|uniref:class I SAM-dependent methyltransferase n=1 Tax=Piscinibacter sakaiensis TaxID=1547922 RepID=UPI003AAF3368